MKDLEYLKLESKLIALLSESQYTSISTIKENVKRGDLNDGEALFLALSGKNESVKCKCQYGIARLVHKEKYLSAYVIYKNYDGFENTHGEYHMNWNNCDKIVRNYISSEEFENDYFGKGCVVDAIEKYGLDSFEIYPIFCYGYENEKEAQKFLEYYCDLDDSRHMFCCNTAEILDDYEGVNIQEVHANWLKSEEGLGWTKEKIRNGAKKGGKASKKNHKKAICIKCKMNGDIFEFNTYKECMEYLCMKSNHTFCEFLEGNSKYNKIYEIIS